MTRVTIVLEFESNEVTLQDIKEYVNQLVEDESLDYEEEVIE